MNKVKMEFAYLFESIDRQTRIRIEASKSKDSMVVPYCNVAQISMTL